MEIKVLGSGCPKCIQLEKNVKEALNILGKEASIEKVTDYVEIVSFGVMSTPALVVDGKVLFAGRVQTPSALAKLLK
ncbi:TM0996/MTH895 family glutaredoxin-like protein [Mycoplasmatota bacterium]|nr:TM0996/MTH895 family glutaredoxin-like protein [Mycoplasmatota bacterium]